MTRLLILIALAVGWALPGETRAQVTLCEPEQVVVVNGKKACRQDEPAQRRAPERTEEDIIAAYERWDARTWENVVALCQAGNSGAGWCPRVVQIVALCRGGRLPEENRIWCESKDLWPAEDAAFLYTVKHHYKGLKSCAAIFSAMNEFGVKLTAPKWPQGFYLRKSRLTHIVEDVSAIKASYNESALSEVVRRAKQLKDSKEKADTALKYLDLAGRLELTEWASILQGTAPDQLPCIDPRKLEVDSSFGACIQAHPTRGSTVQAIEDFMRQVSETDTMQCLAYTAEFKARLGL